MALFVIRQGDTLPALEETLPAEAALATATEVRFHMRLAVRRGMARPKAVVKAPGVIVSAAAGTVRYDWVALDTIVPGLYETEWQVTYAGGGVRTFPRTEFGAVEVLRQLA